MRWSTRKQFERKKALYSWHPWFAWFPVKIQSSKFERRFLETVARKKNNYFSYIYDDISRIERSRIRKSCEKISKELEKE